MRKAVERIKELYTGSPIGQDLIETVVATGGIAAGQALFTDMTPEEIAIVAGVGFGEGMVGRPIVGSIGQRIGKEINKRSPEADQFSHELIENLVNSLPKRMHAGARAKFGPWQHLSGPEQLGALIGHGSGDNLFQAATALAVPTLFSDEPLD